jgi:serine/threonine protein kinase
MKHLNLQGVNESFKDKNNLCIVSEYCDYGSLNREIRKRAEKQDYFSEEELLTLFSNLCHGLKKMHDMNVVHK